MVSRKLLVISSTTVYLFHCRNLSQYFKKLYESVSIRKGNLKFCNVTCTKDLHQILKDQISVAESLKLQRQIWDILQGVRSLGVKFTRNILAWYDN